MHDGTSLQTVCRTAHTECVGLQPHALVLMILCSDELFKSILIECLVEVRLLLIYELRKILCIAFPENLVFLPWIKVRKLALKEYSRLSERLVWLM